jgi:phthalate 4,5-dioxygenase oxygenase subunit
MLSREENELLTGVAGQTPMGQMLRRYWVPACLAEEIEPGGAPVRLRLLGENLVAFRGDDGVVGIMDELCPHRRASLALGRNEDCALTCLYHGWKIAADGRILEMPSEPPNSTFKDRLRHVAYPAREVGPFIWTYLGEPTLEPPLPNYAWSNYPLSNVAVAKIWQSANWVQALEGAIDSAHSSTLHKDGIVLSGSDGAKDGRAGNELVSHRPSADTHPRLQAERTPYGLRYAALRVPLLDPDINQYVRITAWATPYFCFIPPNDRYRIAHIFVPVDEGNTIFYAVQWSEQGDADQDEWRQLMHAQLGVDLDPEYRKLRNLENNYLQDREAMKQGRSFTGIIGIPAQDMAMQETMGPIVDRDKEHLGTSDVAIIMFRRVLLDSLRIHQSGATPVGLSGDAAPAQVRSAERVISKEVAWQTLLDGHNQAVPPVT